MKDHEAHPPVFIDRGQGIYLYDKDGKAYIDGISSWWVNLFGHANPRIIRAVGEQLKRLEHVIFAGFTHAPAEELASRLLSLVPGGLTRMFFANDGTCAVEAALKMSHASWRNLGAPEKCRFLYLSNSYHGEDHGLFGRVRRPALCRAVSAPVRGADRGPGPGMRPLPVRPQPRCLRHGMLHGHGRGHRRPCRYALWRDHRAPCPVRRQFPHAPAGLSGQAAPGHPAAGIHLIADEIAVGFGRTGTLFACEQANITPDFLCLSKAITSGTLPLSCVLTTDAVFDAFYHDYTEDKAFLHSHSYSGNPLACAAAVETLNIFRDDNVIEANRPKMAYLQKAIRERFAGYAHVRDIRTTGWINLGELVADPATGRPFDPTRRIGYQIHHQALSRGALLRNIEDSLYFMPPYIITNQEIDTLVDIALEAVKAVLG
jgi:adenosylmethionine-8-amino-7-oxononanoate aminotransferase